MEEEDLEAELDHSDLGSVLGNGAAASTSTTAEDLNTNTSPARGGHNGSACHRCPD